MDHKIISRHFFRNWNSHPVETGQELSLGKKTLSFVETRMVHWPDSMFTYLKEDKILFSSDGFGQHFAGPERFDDQIGEAIMVHAKKYFANILLLYVPLIKKYLKNLIDAGMEFNMICPDHGIIWRKDPAKIINAYVQWCKQIPEKKAVVIYDTMWQSTEKMAEAIAAGINKEGVPAKPLHLRKWHRSEVMTEVFDAKAIVVGGPTLNNGLFPSLADFLSYMKGLKPLNKIGGAFGSYGWSGDAVKIITQELESMKFEIIDPIKDEKEQEAVGLGIPAVQVNAIEKDKIELKRVYMGLAILFENKREVMPIIQSTQNLEYEIKTTFKNVSF